MYLAVIRKKTKKQKALTEHTPPVFMIICPYCLCLITVLLICNLIVYQQHINCTIEHRLLIWLDSFSGT